MRVRRTHILPVGPVLPPSRFISASLSLSERKSDQDFPAMSTHRLADWICEKSHSTPFLRRY